MINTPPFCSQAFKASACSGRKAEVSKLLRINTEKAARTSLWSGKLAASRETG
jgi:hypothetical protein